MLNIHTTTCITCNQKFDLKGSNTNDFWYCSGSCYQKDLDKHK